MINKIEKQNNIVLNNAIVLSFGIRKSMPVALLKKKTFNSYEYIIAFDYEIIDNKISWSYGYYYEEDIEKATKDFRKVLLGGNLANTFDNKSDFKI